MNKPMTQDEKLLWKMGQERFKEIAEETGLANLLITPDVVSMLKVWFQLGYQEGRMDMFYEIKEIYDNDVDQFIAVFDEHEEEVQ